MLLVKYQMTKYLLQNLKLARRKNLEQKNWSLFKTWKNCETPCIIANCA